jgi:caffeoyl-CoA O-methyltransferase
VRLRRPKHRRDKLYTFEFEPRHAEVAAESFRRAGVSAKTEIFVGPALANLPRIEKHGPFDLVFIDADKVNYPGYLAWAKRNVRVGGAILADNTFAWGMIGDERFDSPEDEAAVLALRRTNREAAEDPAFRATLLPTGEGLTLAVRIL